jgi:hypothetical protein
MIALENIFQVASSRHGKRPVVVAAITLEAIINHHSLGGSNTRLPERLLSGFCNTGSMEAIDNIVAPLDNAQNRNVLSHAKLLRCTIGYNRQIQKKNSMRDRKRKAIRSKI